MERILTPSLDFGRTISHLLPGLLLVGSLLIMYEAVCQKNLVSRLISSSNLLLAAIAVAVILAFMFGLFLDLLFHHRVLQQMLYRKRRFVKLVSWFYKTDYVQRHEVLSEEESRLYKDHQGKAVSDYYFIPIIGVDARRHVLESGVYYSEFFSNMSLSMAVFGISIGSFLVKNPAILGKCEHYALPFGIALGIVSELLALLFVIVGGALEIQYRERMIDLIKGALEHRASTEGRNMPKIMLDTMQYDKLLDATETYDRLLKLQSERKIELLTTHIQRDELGAIGDVKKRTLLEAILTHARLIPTRGAILDKSRVGLARLGNDEDHSLIEHIRGEAWERESNDALIAATAVKDADVFVTDDDTLTRRLKSYPGTKCEVMNFEELDKHLAKLAR